MFSSLFPSANHPLAGIFIQERMFRVARHLPLAVISPQPWFPLQRLLRCWRPGYREPRPLLERIDGITINRPYFFAMPGIGRRFDGFFMAAATWRALRRLRREGRADLIDAHFAYPDGYAASQLGRWLGLPFAITLRGTEFRLRDVPALRARMQIALRRASRVFAVSDSLRSIALEMGADPARSLVVGNGVDLGKFRALDMSDARTRLGLQQDARVLVSVGGLVERKGFHRVLACLPALLAVFPKLILLIIGGPSPEGDWTQRLKALVAELRLTDHVRFLGPIPPQELHIALSAADVFVLATRNEGWANVFLEAMACGLPVVTTRVGGNAEVVCRDDVGVLVPFDDQRALTEGIEAALNRQWDRVMIRSYAADNTWDRRVEVLVRSFGQVHHEAVAAP